MIAIFHTKLSHIAATFAGLAILIFLASWSYGYHSEADRKADALRSYAAAKALERRTEYLETRFLDVEFRFKRSLRVRQ